MKCAEYEERTGTDTAGRDDVTPLFADPALFAELVTDLLEPVDLDAVTHVAGLDAPEFAIGGYAAARADLGFVSVRKAGKSRAPTTDCSGGPSPTTRTPRRPWSYVPPPSTTTGWWSWTTG